MKDGEADRTGRGAELFEELGSELAGQAGVELGTGWHHPALKVHGKIAAMLNRGDLVVKVPHTQAQQLCAEGSATPYEPAPGRVMKEWVRVAGTDSRRWRRLMSDAIGYARELTE